MNIDLMNNFGMGIWSAARLARAACVSALALAVVLSASSCGAKDPEGTGGAQTAPAAVTEPQTVEPPDDGSVERAAALAIFGELDDAVLEENGIDFSDAAQVTEYVEKRREIYSRLASLELSWRDESAQAELRRGVEAMLQYLDGLPAYCAISGSGTEEAEAMRGDLSAIYTSAYGSLTAARQEIEGADAEVS
jgi:hypothetical protein